MILLVSPRWLEHRVTPHKCPHERMSLAFNSVLRHDSAKQEPTFAATRPKELFIRPRLRSFRCLHSFSSPVFTTAVPVAAPSVDLELSSSEPHGLLPVADGSASRRALLHVLEDPHCRWDQHLHIVRCKLELFSSAGDISSSSGFANAALYPHARSAAGVAVEFLNSSSEPPLQEQVHAIPGLDHK